MMAVRTMALDYGERRVGVAVTDPLGLLAQPLETIERSVRADPLFRRLAVLVREYEVGEIVVGNRGCNFDRLAVDGYFKFGQNKVATVRSGESLVGKAVVLECL